MDYTLKMFMEDYKGFDFETGTMVLTKRKTGTSFIINNSNKYIIKKFEKCGVTSWTHTENVIAITIYA